MFDLYLGLIALWLVSLIAFAISIRFPLRSSKRQGVLFMVVVLLAMGLYAIFLRDSVFLAWCLPYSNLIVVGNWFPIGMAVLAGLAWRHSSGPRWRRAWPVTGLALAGSFAAVQPLLGKPPECVEHWDDDGICRQTTSATCTAACAATVLASHGISATEREMAELCLTRRGTTWQGLYRGLKLKTARTPFDVEVFSCSADQLRQLAPGWKILTVGIPRGADVNPIYERQYSWTPGTMHTVLLYDFAPNDRVNMADPDVGREQWTTEDLRVLFRGQGMRLVRR